jgi:hypothetical protein
MLIMSALYPCRVDDAESSVARLEIALLIDGTYVRSFADLGSLTLRSYDFHDLSIVDGAVVTTQLRATNRAGLVSTFSLLRVKDTSPPTCSVARVSLPHPVRG